MRYEAGPDSPAPPIHYMVESGEGWASGELAAACRQRNRWEFMLCVGPLRLFNGTGSPLNPIAVL